MHLDAKLFDFKHYFTYFILPQTTRHTAMGQSMDILTSRLKKEDGTPDLDAFGMKQYSAIVRLKTSYYSFCLPVSLGMIMVGFN